MRVDHITVDELGLFLTWHGGATTRSIALLGVRNPDVLDGPICTEDVRN